MREYSVLRRKRYLFLPGMPPWYLLRRIWGIFLPGRRVVTPSAPEMIPFSARNASAAPSAHDLGHFPARKAVGVSGLQQKKGSRTSSEAYLSDPPGDRTLDPNIKSVVLYQLS